jgi:hypothetical protein
MLAPRITYTRSTCADDPLQLPCGMFERLLETSSSQMKLDHAASVVLDCWLVYLWISLQNLRGGKWLKSMNLTFFDGCAFSTR